MAAALSTSGGGVDLIIGLTGYANSGKDTVGKSIALRYGFKRVAFCDKLKELALKIDPIFENGVHGGFLSGIVAIHGWEAAKEMFPEIRVYLQVLGTDACRAVLGEDVWVRAAHDTMLAAENANVKNFVFTDVRFQNEANYVKSWGGLIVKVERPGVVPSNGHRSDTEIDTLGCDYLFKNDGTVDDVGKKVTEMMNVLEG